MSWDVEVEAAQADMLRKCNEATGGLLPSVGMLILDEGVVMEQLRRERGGT